MKTRLAIVFAVGLLLAGCASGPVYRPAATPSDYGYRDSAIADARYQVSFAGGYGVSRDTVRKLALYRSAQVALSHGADRFQVVSRKTDHVDSQVTPTITTLGYHRPFWITGIGVSNSYTRTRYQTIMEIRIGSVVPKSGADVYDAKQVQKHLETLAETARQ